MTDIINTVAITAIQAQAAADQPEAQVKWIGARRPAKTTVDTAAAAA